MGHTPVLWLRGLGLNVPGDVDLGPEGLHIAMLCGHARSTHLLGLWLVCPAPGGPAELGVVARSRDDLRNAILSEGSPLVAPAADRRRATASLPAPVAAVLVRTLREASLDSLRERPIEGNDGFSLTLAFRDGASPMRSIDAWRPRGHHLDILSVLGTSCAQLEAQWNMEAFRAVRDELEAADAERRGPPPSGVRASGPIVVRREEDATGAGWTVTLTEDEHATVVRGGQRWEATLPSGTHTRVAYAIDPARVRALGNRVGYGAVALSLEIDGRTLPIKCPENKVEPDWAGLPPAVRGDVVRAHALARALEAREDDDGEALVRWFGGLPDAPPPIRTEGLVARFRMDDGRVSLPPSRWFSLFETGVLQRFDASDMAIRGRPVRPFEVSEEQLKAVRIAIERCSSLSSADLEKALAYDDDDRNVRLSVQVPAADGLLSRYFAWSYGPAAPRLEGADREALDRVYALYQALLKVRQLADIT